MRVEEIVAEIFDVSSSELKDPHSQIRADVLKYGGVGWTFLDFPKCRVGLFQSRQLISVMSALLYGGGSLAGKNARQRALRGGAKGNHWQPTTITRGFLAFSCMIVHDVITGSDLRKRDPTPHFGTYDDVLAILDSRRDDEPKILDYLTRALIPPQEDHEANDAPEPYAGKLIDNPTFAAFVPPEEDQE
ncbi:uncharacterized protein JCM15063_002653 [Sporobolomyces koalae]|uniref:uncharacterized protein n=1 Tax=Sporobolomyces koalae TaxID=500713 RepID=UPI003170928E